jgi:hypothetical protein
MLSDRSAPASGATVLDQARQLAGPLAVGAFVSDWVTRAEQLSVLSDRCLFAAREDAHWSPVAARASDRPLSLTPTRRAIFTAQESPGGEPSVSLNVDLTELSGPGRKVVETATAGLDAAEKIVISAAAYSLCQLDNPPELVLEVMNILYEEALHLDAIGHLLGLDHSLVDWIPADRASNWDLVQRCGTPLEYMLLEHCLYEGRGTVASAAGAFQLERLDVPAAVVEVFAAIARQEANHNVSGFRWWKLLDDGTDAQRHKIAATVRAFLEAEPLPEPDDSARSQRKHFPLYLLQLYVASSDFYLVKDEIVAASRAARATGVPGVPLDQLYAASQRAVEWSQSQ